MTFGIRPSVGCVLCTSVGCIPCIMCVCGMIGTSAPQSWGAQWRIDSVVAVRCALCVCATMFSPVFAILIGGIWSCTLWIYHASPLVSRSRVSVCVALFAVYFGVFYFRRVIYLWRDFGRLLAKEFWLPRFRVSKLGRLLAASSISSE